MFRPPPISTLFPHTTPFRSRFTPPRHAPSLLPSAPRSRVSSRRRGSRREQFIRLSRDQRRACHESSRPTGRRRGLRHPLRADRKSKSLKSSNANILYAVFWL